MRRNLGPWERGDCVSNAFELLNCNYLIRIELLGTLGLENYSCIMATRDIVRKFAEEALQIDELLNQRGVIGNAGRVVLILNSASSPRGVTQKEVIAKTSLPKDVVSKQVGALVAQGLLIQKRDSNNSLIKRVYATDAGKQLLCAVKEKLRPSREVQPDPELDGEVLVQTMFDLE